MSGRPFPSGGSFDASVPGSFELRGRRTVSSEPGLIELAPQRTQSASQIESSGRAPTDDEVLGGYEVNSWRWNELEALRFDVDQARRKRDEARFISNLLLGTSGARAGGAYARDRAGQTAARLLGGPLARTLLGPEVGVVTFAGGVAARNEAAAWDRRLERLERRLAELERPERR